MSEKYEIEELYFTEPEGLLRVSAKITRGPTEPGVSHRLCAITSDDITPALDNWRNECLSKSRNKSGEKLRVSDRGKPISTKDVIVANDLGFNYRVAIPPNKTGVSINWEYLYYGDYNDAFAQLEEISLTDIHAQLEERTSSRGKGWTKMNTQQWTDDRPSGGFLPPNEGGLLDV